MIKVQIFRNKDDFIERFTVKGHAGYSEHGSDIVCAAVSAVAYTALGALEELAGISGYSEQEGLLDCSIPSAIGPDVKYKAGIILETMAIGLKQIEYSYRKYVVVLDKEV